MSTIRDFSIEENMVKNYMGYGMYIITDRALPKVEDGFLPVHRKILYAMKESGFTHEKDYAKTLDIIGSTTPYYVHGDSSLAGAMSLLVDTNESQKVNLIEGHGNFSNVLSSGAYSAPRYTSGRLSKFSEDNLFDGLSKNCVKMIGEENHKEPLFLPTTYPNILVMNLMGIAVGMSCNFHGYSLKDVCDYTSKYIMNRDLVASDYLIPDFNDSCELIYNKKEIDSIANTGKGSIKLRGKHKVNNNTLTLYVPYGTTASSLTDEIISKIDKFKEIIDVRNGTGFNKETKREEYVVDIDVKKNTDIDLLMNKLYKNTQAETTVSYNMNCLINYVPKVRGVNEILNAWITTREDCLNKLLTFDLNKNKTELHLLEGLEKVLVDVDKVIEIIRHSKKSEIIKNLCDNFNIDKEQSERINKIRLTELNDEDIKEQIKAINNLRKEISILEYKLSHIDEVIKEQLIEIRDTYGDDRKTEIIYGDNTKEIKDEDLIEDYNCRLIYTPTYIKKHLKQSDSHKLKEDEQILEDIMTTNKSELLIFTNKANRYRISCHKLNTYTPSVLGDYIYNILPINKSENIIKVISVEKEVGNIIFIYKNGKIAKVPVTSFMSNNTKLQNSYNTQQELINIIYTTKDIDILLVNNNGKALIINTQDINSKATRSTQGVTGIKLKADNYIIGAILDVKQEDIFSLVTAKNKNKTFNLSDNIDKERTLYQYLLGKLATQGNYLINCKTTKDSIKDIIKN